MRVLACVEFDGDVCATQAWIDVPPYPEPLFPPLTAAEGTMVSFSIIAVWTIGAKARLVFRAART
jgi:hypothetical protein